MAQPPKEDLKYTPENKNSYCQSWPATAQKTFTVPQCGKEQKEGTNSGGRKQQIPH